MSQTPLNSSSSSSSPSFPHSLITTSPSPASSVDLLPVFKLLRLTVYMMSTMMMMLQSAQQKRRRHDDFHIHNTSGGGGGGSGGGASYKRLKAEDNHSNARANKEKKDKIGERVAALQQLVSPFGKTDTASVLSEATGYIRFLHDQIQVLSAPYLQTATIARNMKEAEHCSLRSRGLCLVPVAATREIAHSNGADLWTPTKVYDQV